MLFEQFLAVLSVVSQIATIIGAAAAVIDVIVTVKKK